MVIFLAPLVIAGYVQYKKQKAEREAQGGPDAEKPEKEEETDEGLVKSISVESISSSSGGSSSPKPNGSGTNGNEPPGPVAKFIRFCENLEKEIQKAQERKRQEAAAEALKQAQAAKSMHHMDSAATTTDVSDDTTESEEVITTEPLNENETVRQNVSILKSRSLPDLHSSTLRGVVNDQEHAILKRCNSMPLITRSGLIVPPDSAIV